MEPTEQRAILTVCLMAAFADGSKGEREREEVRRVAESLAGTGEAPAMAAIFQDVLLKRVDLAAAALPLGSPELRQLAFELAVGVCDADGLRNADETRFLADLGAVLGLGQPQMAAPAATADALATVPLDEIVGGDPSAVAPRAAVAATAGPPVQPAAPVVAAVAPDEAQLDKMILNHAILNGALELLPQSLASMAIIPLQMKMVYRIGAAHGYALDRGHIRDFLATVGVGLTGQYLEEIGRKLIGGLFGKAAGRMVGGLARGATGVAFSFATTYALGHVAKRYYAGGRSMNAQMLKDAFAQMLGQAKSLQAQYAPQIEQQARSVDVGRIVQMVRSS